MALFEKPLHSFGHTIYQTSNHSFDLDHIFLFSDRLILCYYLTSVLLGREEGQFYKICVVLHLFFHVVPLIFLNCAIIFEFGTFTFTWPTCCAKALTTNKGMCKHSCAQLTCDANHLTFLHKHSPSTMFLLCRIT